MSAESGFLPDNAKNNLNPNRLEPAVKDVPSLRRLMCL